MERAEKKKEIKGCKKLESDVNNLQTSINAAALGGLKLLKPETNRNLLVPLEPSDVVQNPKLNNEETGKRITSVTTVALTHTHTRAERLILIFPPW